MAHKFSSSSVLCAVLLLLSKSHAWNFFFFSQNDLRWIFHTYFGSIYHKRKPPPKKLPTQRRRRQQRGDESCMKQYLLVNKLKPLKSSCAHALARSTQLKFKRGHFHGERKIFSLGSARAFCYIKNRIVVVVWVCIRRKKSSKEEKTIF